MRRSSALLAALLLALPAAAQEPKKLTLRWFGHSFFQLTTAAGTKIVFDPHAIEMYPRVQVPADLVLITHPHLDHNQIQSVVEKPKIINGLKVEGRKQDWVTVDEKFQDARIIGVGLYHDKSMGMDRGKNTAFVVEVDGLRIVHLGDLGHELTDAQVKAIGPVDVLLIPIGGIYTINGTDAKAVVAQLKPRLFVVPMHYGTKVFTDLLGPEEFLEDQTNVRKMPDTNELEIDPSAKPEKPEIVLLGWEKKAR